MCKDGTLSVSVWYVSTKTRLIYGIFTFPSDFSQFFLLFYFLFYWSLQFGSHQGSIYNFNRVCLSASQPIWPKTLSSWIALLHLILRYFMWCMKNNFLLNITPKNFYWSTTGIIDPWSLKSGLWCNLQKCTHCVFDLENLNPFCGPFINFVGALLNLILNCLDSFWPIANQKVVNV